jgi:translation initiation factor 1A
MVLTLCTTQQGGKNRRRGKNENDNEKRELTFKEEGQEYAQVVKILGNGRLEALCFDGEKRLAHIRGKLRKKVWINQGDIILLSLREYQDQKGDVILKYSADEARSLKAYGELPESAKINETDTYVASDGPLVVPFLSRRIANQLPSDMAMRASMTMLSLTRIAMVAATRRRSTLMRSEQSTCSFLSCSQGATCR